VDPAAGAADRLDGLARFGREAACWRRTQQEIADGGFLHELVFSRCETADGGAPADRKLAYRDGQRGRTLYAGARMSHTATATRIRVGLYVRLDAKPGQEAALAEFLKSALPLVEREPATLTWYAMRLGPSTFGIYDTFPDDQGREAHLAGQVAAALMQKAPELLAAPPVIQKIDVLAAKLPD